jgi:hypothetical protein
MDQITKLQLALRNEYQEVEKARKAHDEAMKDLNATRRKYQDLQQNPNRGLLGNLISTSKEERLERSQRKVADATHRADLTCATYHLQLATINAAFRVFYDDLMPRILREMDADYYDQCHQVMRTYTDDQRSHVESLTTYAQQLDEQQKNIQQSREQATFFFENMVLFQFQPVVGQSMVAPLQMDALSSRSQKMLQDKLDFVIESHNQLVATIEEQERQRPPLNSMESPSCLPLYELLQLYVKRSKIEAQVIIFHHLCKNFRMKIVFVTTR